MNIKTAKNIHFIGIGGIGMSSLAQILHSQQKNISGSDREASAITNKLSHHGIIVFTPQSANNVHPSIHLVITSNAIPEENPEIEKAKKLQIPIISLGEALGQLTSSFTTIAVCGTHGKSTTTAMIAKVLIENNLDPTVMIGTLMKEFDYNNVRIGKSEFLLIEACEYKRSFLNLHPNIIVITNIETDHLDYFKNDQDYESAFQEFILNLPTDGIIIANNDDPNSKKITSSTSKKTINFSTTKIPTELKLKVPGHHNLSNASAAIAVSESLKLDQNKTIKALNNFEGTWRRFEHKGNLGQTVIIDDYAHHPTEIKATLSAAREKFGPNAKICAVFQPHQYNRTHKLIDQFASSFKDADTVIIPNIYSVRDSAEDQAKISTDIFVSAIKNNHQDVQNGNGLIQATKLLKQNHSNWDAIIVMGAGDITSIHEDLLSTD